MANENSASKNYEVIKPPKDLRNKVRELTPAEASKFDPVAAAEKAIERLSVSFEDWMEKEIVAITNTWEAVARDGLTKETSDALYRASHDIKGQAATLGFPLAGSVAGNLCHLIDNAPDVSDIPITLVEQHVQAIRAIVNERAKTDQDSIGKELANRLADVTDDYLAHQEP
ncbi:MAG: Hpt domain-containing protein [Stappiaceae bacterium]